jgi:hypothetical protein
VLAVLQQSPETLADDAHHEIHDTAGPARYYKINSIYRKLQWSRLHLCRYSIARES